eukprot:TRINITY_DN38819_c0_g1_i1.p1 TRINITY_DN38819_c0_g1~~TRINITY_DN38819_c0_g1_i1.p1  ORF type:complete len:120 (-),score=12.23 TRINITY_DN38819_c0_g1_i1:28-387(-)
MAGENSSTDDEELLALVLVDEPKNSPSSHEKLPIEKISALRNIHPRKSVDVKTVFSFDRDWGRHGQMKTKSFTLTTTSCEDFLLSSWTRCRARFSDRISEICYSPLLLSSANRKGNNFS